MNTEKKAFRILRLTDEFYKTYPKSQYPEILEKRGRPYTCMVFRTKDYTVCVPYRTEISHPYAYHFRKSIRSRQNRSGLDYTKMVIVKKENYLDRVQAVIDDDEYTETIENIGKIQKEAEAFLNDYLKHMMGERRLHPAEYRRRYQYSPLRYFHEELGLTFFAVFCECGRLCKALYLYKKRFHT